MIQCKYRLGVCLMKKVQDFKKCPKCGRLYDNTNIFYCYNDNYPLIDYSTNDPLGEQLKNFDRHILKPTLGKKLSAPAFVPHCPTCGSKKIKRISTLKRITSLHLFGFFSKTAISQFQCGNCGYKW